MKLSTNLNNVLIEYSNGLWGNPPKFDGKDFPVLRSTNIHNGKLSFENVAYRSFTKKELEKYFLEKGDIIITTSSGSEDLVGKNAIFENEKSNYLFSNFTLRLKPNKNLAVPKFLYYYLNSQIAKDQLKRINSTTSGLRNLSVPLYISQPIPIAPLTEQRKIVSILEQADELRRKKKESQEKASKIITALFYKMFGDPVRNEKGWQFKKLKDICIINPRRQQVFDDNFEVSFIPMASIDEYHGIIKNNQTRTFGTVKQGFTYFEENDVIFAKITPCMENGKAAIARELTNSIGYGSTEFHVLRELKEKTTPQFLFALVRLEMFRALSKTNFTGTAGQQRVPSSFIENLKIGLPPFELQKQFSKSVDIIQENDRKYNQLTDSLEKIFQILLHNAFTGSLTAKWRESNMELLEKETEQRKKEYGF